MDAMTTTIVMIAVLFGTLVIGLAADPKSKDM